LTAYLRSTMRFLIWHGQIAVWPITRSGERRATARGKVLFDLLKVDPRRPCLGRSVSVPFNPLTNGYDAFLFCTDGRERNISRHISAVRLLAQFFVDEGRKEPKREQRHVIEQKKIQFLLKLCCNLHCDTSNSSHDPGTHSLRCVGEAILVFLSTPYIAELKQ
jgi:hypothetical protein